MAQYPPDDFFNQQQPPLPTPTSRTPLILGIIGGIAVVGMLFCCGGGLLLMQFGVGVMTVEVQDDLAVRPEMQEHIGEIRSFKVNLVRSGAQEDSETFVYDVEGSKGKGYVIVRHVTDENGAEVIESAELTLSDGRKIPIDTSR